MTHDPIRFTKITKLKQFFKFYMSDLSFINFNKKNLHLNNKAFLVKYKQMWFDKVLHE